MPAGTAAFYAAGTPAGLGPYNPLQLNHFGRVPMNRLSRLLAAGAAAIVLLASGLPAPSAEAHPFWRPGFFHPVFFPRPVFYRALYLPPPPPVYVVPRVAYLPPPSPPIAYGYGYDYGYRYGYRYHHRRVVHRHVHRVSHKPGCTCPGTTSAPAPAPAPAPTGS